MKLKIKFFLEKKNCDYAKKHKMLSLKHFCFKYFLFYLLKEINANIFKIKCVSHHWSKTCLFIIPLNPVSQFVFENFYSYLF